MDATVKRKARSPKVARAQPPRPAEPAHESDGAHLELRIWLRLLSCATRIEKAPVSYTHLTLPTILRV